MEMTTIYAVVVSLRVYPSRSQFFQYEPVTLSCEDPRNSSAWRVKRNTSTSINQDCPSSWNKRHGSTCSFDYLYELDSGVYWCESAEGQRSNLVNITAKAGPVILEGPAHPVEEGQLLTLYCRTKKIFSSNLTRFYRNELLIGSSSTGKLTISRVSKSDEGIYKCNVSGAGESPSSWLTVKGAHDPETPPSTITHVLLPVVGVCLLLVALMVLCLWKNHKGKVNRAVSYTDVTITQEVTPQRISDVGATSTFYSQLKPAAS